MCELAGDSKRQRAFMGSLTLMSVEGERVRLAVDDPSHLSYARTRAEQLGDLFREAMGAAVRVTFEDDDGAGAGAADSAGAPASAGHDEALDDPVVRKAMELFDARVVDVQRDDRH